MAKQIPAAGRSPHTRVTTRAPQGGASARSSPECSRRILRSKQAVFIVQVAAVRPLSDQRSEAEEHMNKVRRPSPSWTEYVPLVARTFTPNALVHHICPCQSASRALLLGNFFRISLEAAGSCTALFQGVITNCSLCHDNKTSSFTHKISVYIVTG